LLGERFFENSKANQVLVSVAHSSVFEPDALAFALASGRVAGAWFDSMEPGMLDPGGRLRGLETIQVTPRVSGTTVQSRIRSAWIVARRIDALLRSESAEAQQELSEGPANDLADLADDSAPS
jgi:phosphoglycerate dehydrogenase-like enzyme